MLGGGGGAEFWEQLFSVSGLLLQAKRPLISEQRGQTAAATEGPERALFICGAENNRRLGCTVAFVFSCFLSCRGLML